MKKTADDRGWIPFAQHWGCALPILLLFICSMLGSALRWMATTGNFRWYLCGYSTVVVGGILMGYAKWPAYRAGDFTTFGVRTVPEQRRRWYWLAWALVGVGTIFCVIFAFIANHESH